jgi:preprotein translocase subunit Sec61beta
MPAVMDAPRNTVRLQFLHGDVVCFAMEQAGIPILRDVRVRNDGIESLVGAELGIQLQPDLGAETRFSIPALASGQVHELGRPDVRLEPGRLRKVVERERATLCLRVYAQGECLAEEIRNVDVLAFNEWPGQRAPIGLLASFVTPNQTALVPLVSDVKSALATATGSNAIDGYQARSKDRVLQFVRYAFECIRQRDVSYATLPASYEETGQKIRLVETVLAERTANCLDATLLSASLLECFGLRPLLILMRGHALLGVWLLEEQFPEGIVEDSARLRTLMDLGQIVALETTLALGESNTPDAFERAIARAREALTRDPQFVAALDVHVLRDDGYRPLSFRTLDGQPGHLPAEYETVDIEAVRRLLREPDEASQDSPSHAAPMSPAARRFQKWKDSLLDLTLRNKLLHFRTSRRGSLPLDVPDLAQFEDLLAADKTFEVLPKPSNEANDSRSPELVAARNVPVAVKERRLQDLAGGRLHSPLSSEELSNRALFLERTAKTDLEEGGASTLFVAIGLLRWFESPDSDEPKLTPLLLYPVSLRFDRQKRRTTLRKLDEDAVPNQTLIEKMRRDFRVDLTRLSTLDADDSGIDVPAMLRAARQSIQQMPRWEILEEAHLGHFTFTKFLMWKDLHENESELVANRVVQHIADHDLAIPLSTPSRVSPEDLDEQIAPSDLPCVLSADSSQMLAMHAALSGTGLVLQGPPGTGKSQTITNLIAAALANGKSVLFVSEKMAALEVVHRRLRDVGLEDFCLELHSHKTTRKQVIESFGRALQAPAASDNSASWAQSSAELARLKTQLNQYVRALHAPTALGKSLYDIMGRQIELASSPELDLPLTDPLQLSAERFAQLRAAVDEFATRAGPVTPCSDNPWRWSSQQDWTSALEEELTSVAASLPDALREVDESASDLAATLVTPPPAATDALVQLVSQSRAIEHELEALCQETAAGPVPRDALEAATWPQLRTAVHDYTHRRRAHARVQTALSARWSDGFRVEELSALAALFKRWTNAFVVFAWMFLWSARRRLRKLARAGLPSNPQILEDIEAARATPREQDELRRSEQALCVELADVWSENPDPDALDATIARGERARTAWQRVRTLPGGVACGDDLATWRKMLERLVPQRMRLERALDVAAVAEQRFVEITRPSSRPWPDTASPMHRSELGAVALRASHAITHFRNWCLYQREAANLVTLGLRRLVDAHKAGSVTAEQIAACWERAVLTRWRKAAVDAEPALRNFSDLVQDRTVLKFTDCDAAHELLAREWIRGRLRARVPETETARKDSELQLLRREIQKKARHIAIRKLIQSIPELRQRLKPCFLMSPLSVAQYLPAASAFDLVIFDEASQIETHDAIGAIARGNQAIIVGDSKQLPPTRFFSRSIDTDETREHDDDVVDLESILDEAKARNLPELTLGWHYRSRHDALIEFSNKRYYEDRLQVFPSARSSVEDLGIAWHPVPEGMFYSSASRANTRTNPEEAKALVAHLTSSLMRYEPAARTFGVVTFSLSQKELINELLEREREAHPEIERHWAGTEPMFVKNLENVQGDERDEILFSIAYAKNENGKLNHHFGPLSNPGGERRLNVAITRARKMLRVFSTLTHDQVELSRTKAQGAEDLRAFLRFAVERGHESQQRVSAPVFDSALERDIYQTLTDAGYVVRTKVGCGAYRVDLAVEHPQQPGVYALAIECDGPMYDSAKACRDRDRLRAEVLRDLSWSTYRVWSMAWHFGREREIAKLLAAVKKACAEAAEQPLASLSAPVEGHENRRSSPTQGTRPKQSGSSDVPAARERVDRGTRVRTTGSSRPGRSNGSPASVHTEQVATEQVATVRRASKVSTRSAGAVASRAAGSVRARSEATLLRASQLGAFANYDLLQELRGGGMAQCYRARDRATGQVVFLKRVRVGSMHEESLQRELDIYSKLQSSSCENVLTILGQERDEEYVALVTEFADGGDLEHHVRAQRGERLEPAEAVAIALDVARGLVQLHALAIVHRDLKPANVLRSAGKWKIADFGIAKDQHHAMPGATFQQAGSYGYAPPEQWAGTQADPSADVFALGKLVAFMVTGGTDPDAIPLKCQALRQLAFQCTAHPATERPSSGQVLRVLEKRS